MSENNLDLEIERRDDGFFDLVIEDGDFKTSTSLQTPIFMSLFEERRADQSEQPVPRLRRGWWGNELNPISGFEMGSKLWLLFQSQRTDRALNLSEVYARESLDWLVADGIVPSIEIFSEFTENGIMINMTGADGVVIEKSVELETA